MRFLIRRLLSLVLVLLGMSVILFGITHYLPADPARVALGEDARADAVEAYRRQIGLDQPAPVQYLRYLGGLLRGDLGTSIISRRPVAEDLRAYLPATLELAATSFILSILVAVPLGIASAVKRGSGIDHLSAVVSLFTVSMPVFWLGLVLQLVFYGQTGWLPAGGRIDDTIPPPPTVTGFMTIDSLLARDPEAFLSALQHLILPAFVLSNVNLAVLARTTRSSLLDVLREGYVATARAKGLAERVVLLRHALKNAAVPIVTVAGLRLGDMMSGAVLTETIFAWPGIGRYAVYSIGTVDFPAVMGVALVATLLYALINIAVDLLQFWLDPRVSAA